MKDLEEVFITIMSLFIIIVIVTSVITLGLMDYLRRLVQQFYNAIKHLTI